MLVLLKALTQLLTIAVELCLHYENQPGLSLGRGAATREVETRKMPVRKINEVTQPITTNSISFHHNHY